jgi:hypothetical protein
MLAAGGAPMFSIQDFPAGEYVQCFKRFLEIEHYQDIQEIVEQVDDSIHYGVQVSGFVALASDTYICSLSSLRQV